MTAETRLAVISLDDMRVSTRMNLPDVATILASWSRTHQRAAVMGALDDNGEEVHLTADQLSRLTSLLRNPMPPAALRLAYPDAEISGSVLLHIPVDEPEWARVGDAVAEQIEAGLYVSDDDIRDALWLLLEGCHLPNAAISMKRLAFARDLPDDPLFVPVELWERFDGSGRRMPWLDVLKLVPAEGALLFGSRITAIASELAERHERHQAQDSGQPAVLTEVVIRL